MNLTEATKFDVDPNILEPPNFALVKADEKAKFCVGPHRFESSKFALVKGAEAAKFCVDRKTLDPLNFALVKAEEATRTADESNFTEFAIFTEIPTGCVGDEIWRN
jgi:hypothetical protein